MKSFPTRDDLAQDLAQAVATALTQAITRNGSATLAVSGGSTPQRFLECLSFQDIEWREVTVTLVDERQVDETSPRSNARLVKAALLQNKAAAAHFVALYQNVKQASALGLDVVVLGMGNDGHTASFFPEADRLVEALNPEVVADIIEINAPGAGEARLTFPLAKLLAAKALFLHIEGAQKMDVLAKARAGHDIMAMPIRAVLQSHHPLEIYWCP